MCGLFGFTIYNENVKNFTRLLNELAGGASERGTHATGISYNYNDQHIIYKRPLPASKMHFAHINGVRAVTGHTRHATQGKAKNNYNNHPFSGACKNVRFSLSHNGIIYNDYELKKAENLPASKIETDSYILTQMLEKRKKLDFKTISECVEKLQGYYTFTILNDKNELYIVKGDSPLTLIRLTRLKILVYASTDNILFTALKKSGISDELKKGYFELIPLTEGDILKISPDGKITQDHFTPCQTVYNWRNWYDYDITDLYVDDEYINDLKQVASCYGYSPDDIDDMLIDGYSPDDIADYLYSGVLTE